MFNLNIFYLGDQMNSFREWLEIAEKSGMTEVAAWLKQFEQRVVSSIKTHEGYISLSISSLASVVASIATSASSVGNQSPMSLAASVVHSGDLLSEAIDKGKLAVGAVSDMGLGWNAKDSKAFEKGMNAGRHSLPQMVGREMGLLFEIEVFVFLVENFKLKTIGEKDLTWAMGERNRLNEMILMKSGKNLGRLAIEFIVGHASGKSGMGNLIYSKAMKLVRQCVVDSIEFTGGNAGEYTARLKSDTADLRIGCEKYLPGVRSDVGFSLKAVTETRIEVRSFRPLRALKALGAGSRMLEKIEFIFEDPFGEHDSLSKRKSLMEAMKKAAELNYTNKGKKFANLLEFLVTGGADTIPAYRSLLSGDSSPGWSGAIEKDFVTGDGPGRKLGAKSGSSPVIEVKSNDTYVKITYMVGGGNYYGTSVIFEPTADGSSVSVSVNNLVSRRKN